MTGTVGEDRLGARGDDVYAMIIAAHAGLSEAESRQLNTYLVLLLANAVGDPARIGEALQAARHAVRAGEVPPAR